MNEQTVRVEGPHRGQPVLTAGKPLDSAPAAMVLLHGRGATAHSMLSLAETLGHPELACLAPQAANGTWYPYSFLAPLERNEPYLSSGMAAISDLLDRLGEAGIRRERAILLGFSQGACLALEYAARHAQRYGGVVGLSGGLIGRQKDPWAYEGWLDGTPIFLGCSDVDSHIPRERVEQSEAVLSQLGGEVTLRLYPGMGHSINEDELNAVREMMAQVSEPAQGTHSR